MPPDHEIVVTARWLKEQCDTAAADIGHGTTFGLPWPNGACPRSTVFTCYDDAGRSVPLQSWPTAYWPDGSIKWSAHAIALCHSDAYHVVTRRPGTQAGPTEPVETARVCMGDDSVVIDTGRLVVELARSGSYIVKSISAANGAVVGCDGHLVLLSRAGEEGQQEREGRGKRGGGEEELQSRVDSVIVEQDGPVRVVVAVRGKHQAARETGGTGDAVDGNTAWLPFLLRFYFYAGSEAVRIVHTLVYDSTPTTAIRGLGLRIHVPLYNTELHNRHVRIAGVGAGVLAEAVHGVTGLWRDPGVEARRAQRHGRPLPTTDSDFATLHRWVPAWGDYSLAQLSPDGFTAKKRTRAGHSWVNIPGGTRAGGLVYLGSALTGGLAVGLRYFWERYPTGLDIRNAVTDRGSITLWLYSPAAEPMDLRPYHDGLGQNTYDDQLDALKITYEDWEPGLGSPYGIARTNEIVLFGLAQTPSARETVRLVDLVRNPPLLVAPLEHIYNTGALGRYWIPFSLVVDAGPSGHDSSSSARHRLELLFQFYKGQIEQRRWYGFWDHGDIMHTYDADRHAWRYDVGGYAWDNSELSPDLWLWLYFLCTGRADVFRCAEALTRHTSEVDAYHLGPYRGLGTRHGVQHWSDSCKQARVANALYRRVFYFLTADERTGELLDETLAAETAFLALDPYRKIRPDRGVYQPIPEAVNISLGTDWSALASAWLVAWERGGPAATVSREKLLRSTRGISRLRNGFVTGLALYNTHTGDIAPPAADPENSVGVVKISHLSAMFGLVEVCAELIELIGLAELAGLTERTEPLNVTTEIAEPTADSAESAEVAEKEQPPSFQDVWIDYCSFFNAPEEEQRRRYGCSFGKLQLRQGHSRLTAYAANRLASPALAERARHEFVTGDGYDLATPWTVLPIDACETLAPADEAPWISTNITALYGLAAIQNLAWLREVGEREDHVG